MTVTPFRQPASPILPIILQRWSPRAFPEHPMAETELLGLLEAARWAPSSYNSQPWRFAYSLRGDAHWNTYQGFFNANNARWAHAASALVLIASDRHFVSPRTGKTEESHTHTFDAGCAWGYLALQAAADGWACHAMAGFDHDKARAATGLSQECELHALIAIGRQGGDPASLPEDLKSRETPSSRNPLAVTAQAGRFAG